MKKPLIGILANKVYTHDTVYPYVYRYYISQEYLISFKKAGAQIIGLFPPDDKADLQDQIDLLDGLVIPGGNDVDPLLYEQEPYATLGSIVGDIDRFYIEAFNVAGSKKLPVFGICKGLQLINVACGGTLLQDISMQRKQSIHHTQTHERFEPSHAVQIESESFLYPVFGSTTLVNSHHHQAIDEIGSHLRAVAYANDGIIEAIQHETLPIYAVQWHPEMMCAAHDSKAEELLRNFVIRCSE